MQSKFSQSLAHACGGRRYCFVIMTYHEGYARFCEIRRIIAEETGFECLRADDVSAPGESIRDKVHAAIEGAVFLLADITEPRPNIFYEIGYATARNKPVLLLIRKGVEPPTDLHGVELIPYLDNREGWPALQHELRQHLRVHKNSSVSFVRAMIVPPDPRPSYMILSPKNPRVGARFPKHPREHRTYGDYLGLTGIFTAFASVFGEHCAPEIVNATQAAPEIAEWDANLFLIGSPKVNPFTERFLATMQASRSPNWRLAPAVGSPQGGDYEVQLSGSTRSGAFLTSGGENPKGGVRGHDHGLIVRGPHPSFPKRTVTIMAGPHSLGTGAACLAATKPILVGEIARRLSGMIDLTTHDRTFWVLVKATASADDHLDDSRVEIVDAGVYG